jgi:hypothetical protein
LPEYHSADTTVVTVDEFGMVTAVGEGETVITISSPDGMVTTDCVIRVSSNAAHTHEMRYFNRAESTCTQDGHEPYYLCTQCGCRFADEAGQIQYTKTAEFIIPASHNKLFFKNLGQYHVQRCKCGEELAETKQLHEDSDQDGKCDICSLPCDYSDPISPTLPNQGQDQEPQQTKLLPIILGVAVIVVVVSIILIIKRKRRGY